MRKLGSISGMKNPQRTRQAWLLLLVVLLPASLLLPSTAEGIPSLKLSRRVGPPTTRVVLSGTGFDPEKIVKVFFGKTYLTECVTDRKGDFFHVVIDIPRKATPRSYDVSAVEQPNGNSAKQLFLVRTDWKQTGFGPAQRGLNPYENVLDVKTVGKLKKQWSYTGTGNANFFLYLPTPIIAEGLVYYSGAGLYALSAEDGALAWSFQTHSEEPFNGLAVAGSTLYIGSPLDSNFYALDAKTGKQIWKFETAPANFSSPTVIDGVVYFGADSSIYALDAKTGAVFWSYVADSEVFKSSPAVAEGKLYEVSGDGKLSALDAGTGVVLWSRQFAGTIASPVVSRGIVYLASLDRNLYAVDAKTGSFVWSFATKEPIEGTPVVADGILYFLSDESTLYALDASTGAKRWSHTLFGPSTNLGYLAIANGVLYVPDNWIWAFDAQTGALLYKSPALSLDAVVVANGVLYGGASIYTGGVLYAYGVDRLGREH